MIEKIKSLDNRTYKNENSQDPNEPKFKLKSKIGELMNLTKIMGEKEIQQEVAYYFVNNLCVDFLVKKVIIAEDK